METLSRRRDLEYLIALAKSGGLGGDIVWAPPAGDHAAARVEQTLRAVLTNRWRSLPVADPRAR